MGAGDRPLTSRLMQLRGAICAKIKAVAGDGVDVAGHYGRFSEDELKKFLASAPAVRVAVLALDDPCPTSDDGVDYLARIGVYVVTKDGPVVGGRDEAAVALVEAILVLSDRQRWGLGGFVRAARSATAANLYSAEAQGGGNALWAVDLRQPIRLEPAGEGTDPFQLQALFAGFAPRIGAAHEADYVRVPTDG